MAYVLGGTVYDADGDPVAGRIVRAYRRDTGALLGSATTGDGTTEVLGDEHYNSVSLLLNLNGANDSTTFTDTSPSPKTITRSGTLIKTDQSKYGGASAYFASGNILTVPSSSAFDFGAGDFTVELWMRTASTSAGQRVLIDRGNFSGFTPWMLVQSGSSMRFSCTVSGTSWLVDLFASSVLTANTWHHIAGTRSGNVFRLFVDGVQVATATASGTLLTISSAVAIGRTNDNNLPFVGHMDDIRVTKGIARYTSAFTPPASQFHSNLPSAASPLGEYTINCGSYSDECNIICLDDDAGTLENDLICRAYPVAV